MVDAFADLSGDDQWIHVDVERAKQESPVQALRRSGLVMVAEPADERPNGQDPARARPQD